AFHGFARFHELRAVVLCFVPFSSGPWAVVATQASDPSGQPGTISLDPVNFEAAWNALQVGELLPRYDQRELRATPQLPQSYPSQAIDLGCGVITIVAGGRGRCELVRGRRMAVGRERVPSTKRYGSVGEGGSGR